jgi:hypothetical protein
MFYGIQLNRFIAAWIPCGPQDHFPAAMYLEHGKHFPLGQGPPQSLTACFYIVQEQI